MSELVKYEEARRLLAEAVAVDEVQNIRNKAEAMRAYARQAKNRDLEIQAARIRFRAERRLGELIIAQKETVGLNAGSRGQLKGKKSSGSAVAEQPEDSRPTLEQAGIDRKLSSRAQRMAAIEPERFEQLLELHRAEVLEGNNKVSIDLMRTSAEADGRERRRNLARALSDTSAILPVGRKYPCAYIDVPWARNAGISNRSYENHYPTMTWSEILAFLREARDVLLPDAWAFFWIPRAHLLALVEIEIEVAVAATGEVVLAKVDMPLGWAVAQALGMDSYSTCFVWTKTDDEHPDESGTGLIAWDQDELLLLFKRGQGLPKPSSDEKFGSNHRERAREHSRKPEYYRHMIATMTGGLPVLEMFARVDDEHPLPPGWDACGNQADAAAPPARQPCPASNAGLEPIEIEQASFAAELPSAHKSDAAAVDTISERVSPTVAVTTLGQVQGEAAAPLSSGANEIPELAFPLAELAELNLFTVFFDPASAEEAAALAPAYVKRGLVHEWCGEWRLTPAGGIRRQVVEREREARESLCRRHLSADDFDEWKGLEAILARQDIAAERVRHLVGLDFAGVTTKRIYLTDAGNVRLAELDAIVDRAAGRGAIAPTPIPPKQLNLTEVVQRGT